MEKSSRSEKTDLVKLFIVLMGLSALGFGIGAAYLYHSQKQYEGMLQTENRALEYMKKVTESPENKPFWGFEPSAANKTTGIELADYIRRKAKSHGIKPKNSSTSPKDRHDYLETKTNLKLDSVTMEQVVRYLYNVQHGRSDVFITHLKLSRFDYDQPIPTCNAAVDFVVFEESKKRRSGK